MDGPPLPDDLRAMLEAVRRVGRPRLVGGAVRDWLLGQAPKNFDVEVAGVDFEGLRRALAPFGAEDSHISVDRILRVLSDSRPYSRASIADRPSRAMSAPHSQTAPLTTPAAAPATAVSQPLPAKSGSMSALAVDELRAPAAAPALASAVAS